MFQKEEAFELVFEGWVDLKLIKVKRCIFSKGNSLGTRMKCEKHRTQMEEGGGSPVCPESGVQGWRRVNKVQGWRQKLGVTPWRILHTKNNDK